MCPKPEDFDFPMSQFFRVYTSETPPLPKLKPKSKKIRMPGGSWLTLVEGPIDDTNAAAVLENSRRLGTLPKTTKKK